MITIDLKIYQGSTRGFSDIRSETVEPSISAIRAAVKRLETEYPGTLGYWVFLDGIRKDQINSVNKITLAIKDFEGRGKKDRAADWNQVLISWRNQNNV